ncbi:MAG: M56 family metallopeptidase, partial [Gemmatimonadales bacterium]
ELSHVKRHDYLTQLLGRFACALHWFNPLVWIAARRMMIEREHACDDRVLSSGSRPSDYAAALLDIARSMRNGPLASVASVAMARRSQLSDRLLAVLDAGRKRANVTGKLVARAGVAAAFVVLPIAGAGIGASESPEESSDPQLTEVDSASTTRVSTPLETLASLSAATDVLASSGSTSGAISAIRVSQSECDWNARHNSTSTSVSSNDRETSVRIRVGNCRLRIELSGDITFNDDETDVTSISRGGYLEIEERDGRTRRKIEIERNGADLERRWVVDGDQQVFGADARAFLADMLPLLFRRVGLQAEERATRILEQQGVDGLLREISLIPSDHTARKYFGVALLKGKLDVSQVRKIVRLAGQEIASDFELAQLLVDVAESHPVDEAVKAAYVEAAGTIGSDFEHRRVLSAILARDALSTEVAAEMLAQATEINSDFELAELLVGIMGKHPIDKALTPAFFNAVKTIGSDFEQRRVLNKVLDVRPLTEEAVAAILESSLSISSDFELARVLIKIANRFEIGDALRPAFLEAADSISSEYERGRVMSALAPRGKVG